MKFKRLLIALAFALNTGLAVSASDSSNLSGFDFNYSVDLNKSIGLTQVFDDGDRTYFQFTQAENFPALYAIKNGKKEKIALEVRPPYLIAAGVAKKFALSANNGKNTIYVSYNGTRSDDVVAEKMTEADAAKEANKQKTADEVSKLNKTSTKEVTRESDEASKPVKAVKSKVTKKSLVNDDEGSSSEEGKDKAPALVTGSLLNVPFFENSITLSKKAKEDLIKSIPNISDSARIVVRGRPSVKGDENIAGTRALVIKNFLVDNGVDESVIETTQDANVKAGKNHGFYVSELILLSGEKSKKAQAAKKAADTSLNIKAGDLISKQLSAWAKRGYDYNLQWEASEYRATAPLVLNTGFNDTLDAVAGSMKINGVDLDVTIYDNKVIRVVEMKK